MKTRRAYLPKSRWLNPLVIYAALAALQLVLQWASGQQIQAPPYLLS